MNKKAIRSMMNPVRLKIIREMTKRNELTTKEIQELCGDIAQATLYRHLTDLRKNQIIEVVSENKVRGTVEKVYRIKIDPDVEIQKNIKKLSKEDISEIFSQFIISILSDFDEFLELSPNPLELQNKTALRTTSIFLSDDEFHELLEEFHTSLSKRYDYEASPTRKLRKISTIATTSIDINIKE